jgi:hypothetical protein
MPLTSAVDEGETWMPEDDSTVGEHEVIESAEALFRHLHEAHGVEAAAGLDPDSTPVEPWLRRHAALERAARRSARESREADRPEPRRERPEPAAARRDRPRDAFGQGGRPEAGHGGRVFDQQRDRQPPDERQRATRPGGQASSGQPSSSGHAAAARAASGRPTSGQARPDQAGAAQGGGVRDPLVRALAAELVRLGHDERAVWRYVRRYVALTPEGGLTGEAGIRASFLDPILDVIAEQLDPTAGATRTGAGAQGESGESGDAGDAGGGTRAGGGAGDRRSPEDAQDDLMAIANVFRRRQAERSAI